MKKIFNLITAGLFAVNAIAQQPPTPNPTSDPSLPLPVPQKGTVAWYRGGNAIAGPSGNANIFGTMWNSPVYYYTGGLNRMALFSNIGSNGGSGNGALAIHHNPANPITAPTSLLNVGEPTFFGQQPWMRVGTSYGLDNDMAYFGMKREGTDRVDAIIAWGNDAAGVYGPDVLRFHHTSTQSELARFAPNGGNGFGNFYNYGINTQPVRRLEVLDANPSTGANANAPQLRLTYTFNQNATLGVYSEFQTTSNGDLYFNTRTGPGSANARSFGFHKFNPLNTVEIAAQQNSPYLPTGATGSSGLRFTSLTSANTTVPNGTNGVNSTKVLTVDGNGDVVLTDANAVPTTNNGISINAGVVQLGVPCSSSAAIKTANALQTDRTIHLNGKNLIFADGGRVGIGRPLTSCTVGNKLEITSGPGMPYYVTGGAGTGSSGLRLTFLTSAKTTVPNGTNGVNSSKVLTVDQNGDVVLTDVLPGATLGNACGATTQNPLTNNWEIPMAGNNLNFTMPTNSTSQITIGAPNCISTPARLAVGNDHYDVGAIVLSNFNSTNQLVGLSAQSINLGIGNTIGVNAISSGGNLNSIGVNSQSNGNSKYNFAFNGNARNGTVFSMAANLDVLGSTSPLNQCINTEIFGGNNPIANNFGISSTVNNMGVVNYGGFFSAIGASQNIGVYGEANGSSTGTTPSPSQANLAGFFNGDVYISGSFGPSDQNLKEHIDTITNALSIIKQLKPKSFDYKHSSYPSMHLPSGKQYGLIAQEVETIIPELVSNNVQPAKLDSLGNVLIPAINFKGLEYTQLIPFLIKGMQEQQAKIDSLTKQLNSKDSIQDARLSALENAINQCCSNAATRNNNSNLNQLDIELSDKDAIVLNQNVPNPFAEQTTITYNVPSSVEKAQLIFFNSNGQVIQTVDIKTRGKGKVNVFASDLSSGLYHYTLVADGKVVDSKKMVRE